MNHMTGANLVPTKLVVTESDQGRIVSLESSRGDTLLMSPPLADKRAAAGAIRSIKAVLKGSVAVDDRTMTTPAKPSRPARIAPAATVAKATTAAVAPSPARKSRAAKAPAGPPAAAAATTPKPTPKTGKRATRTAK
jgi:hypothetical protein